MSSLVWIATAGGITSAGMAIVVAILALRNSGLRLDVRRTETLQRAAEAALKLSGRELSEYKQRSESAMAVLVDRLEYYERHELDAIEEEPDRDRRIQRRRDWVRDILSRA